MDYRTYKMKTFAEKPEVRAEYEQLGPQYEAICAAIESRKAAGLTQKQLAEKMGTAQANISRFENGNSNPSLEFLQKMAACMGKTLHVSRSDLCFKECTVRFLRAVHFCLQKTLDKSRQFCIIICGNYLWSLFEEKPL